MEHLDWNKCLDRYILEGVMSSEDYANLNIEQRYWVQEWKKFIKRTNSKNNG